MAYRYESATIGRVVIGLVVLGLTSVAFIGWLAWNRVPVPDSLTAIGVGSMTALATLLTTFTPSPIPGGRRAADATATPTAPGEIPSTAGLADGTLGAGTTVSGKGDQHG